jgi:GMP synthase (glutamine-hydrolysing)
VAKSGGVLVVDFGAQYAQLIARRVREALIYSEIVPSTIKAAEVKAKNPSAIILSGGPSSVYAEHAPAIDKEIFSLGVPIFGICYGFQVMAATLGGVVSRTGKSEFGRTQTTVVPESQVFAGLSPQQKTWMSHGDAVTQSPEGFVVTASTDVTPIAAFENSTGMLAGVQFHPEVLHTENGQKILENWLLNVANCEATWTTKNIAETEIVEAKRVIGTKHVICGLSGGVDSAVAAAIDHGLLRKGEAEQVERDFVASTGVKLVTIDATQQFLNALKGVSDPEEKRKIIGREFIRTFESAARDIAAGGDVEFLVQGTLYPDVVESGGGTGTANIKSHHNVGGLPDDLKFKLVEPLRSLFKDEVRQVGIELGLPEQIVWRQPFPGPGLAIRIVGEVTKERLALLRHADAIVREELKSAELDRAIWQCPVVLLADVRSVGVQGDGRTYGHPIVLRPVSSEDAMTADWSRLPYEVLEKISTRITNEVPDVNRVVLDVTSKPPGTIEWE